MNLICTYNAKNFIQYCLKLSTSRLTSACTLLAKNPLRKYFAQNIMRYVISIETTANSIQMEVGIRVWFWRLWAKVHLETFRSPSGRRFYPNHNLIPIAWLFFRDVTPRNLTIV